MPFWSSATITILNMYKNPLNVCLMVKIIPNVLLKTENGYFSTNVVYHNGNTSEGYIELLNISNVHGHVVGILLYNCFSSLFYHIVH